MNESLEALRGEVLDRIQQSNSEMEIEQLRVEVLGRKGKLTLLLRGLADLPAEERPQAGQELNQLRRVVEEHLDNNPKSAPSKRRKSISRFRVRAGRGAGLIR